MKDVAPLQDTFDDTTILGWMIQTEDLTTPAQPEIAVDSLKIGGARLESNGEYDGKWPMNRSAAKSLRAGEWACDNQDPHRCSPLPKVPTGADQSH
ncbi:hypothetical protein ACNKHK_19320 [Shigella flexneri]